MIDLTVKDQIDGALRAEASTPRCELVVVVNEEGHRHIRSYMDGNGQYRGARVDINLRQIEEWQIRKVDLLASGYVLPHDA